MKYLLIITLLLISNVFSATAVVGGYIRPNSNASCIQETFETLLCTINSNNPTYEFQLDINTSPDISVDNVKITGISGMLGSGVSVPNNLLMDRVSNNKFSWNVDDQKSSTINYIIRLKINYEYFSETGFVNVSWTMQNYF